MCLGSDIPPPAKNAPPPQAAKLPDTAPLKRRNAGATGSLAAPTGSTLLTGPSGITAGQQSIGSSSLLGGG